MQTWAKRGIQTALVTGGLMMLGTGIASADDTIHPDTPPSALDASVKVPVRIDNNAIGTPLGDRHLPSVNRDVTVAPGSVAKKLPLAKAAADDNDVLRGNKVVGNVVAPVKVTGNAVAVLGDASVADESQQHVTNTQDVETDGSGSGLAGNVVNLAYGLPIDVSGNAVAAGGTATTLNSSSQSATADGDITTSGDRGAVSGNVVAAQGATPVQVVGNSASLAGVATAISDASSDATAGGTIETSGEDGALVGNAAGAPVALPVRVSGDSASLGGVADSLSSATTTAQAGDEQPDIYGVPAYIETDGSGGGTLSGNAVAPAVSGPAAVDCDSANLGGNTGSLCETTTDAAAGGGTRTFGDDSVLSGAIGAAPVAMPAQVQSNCGTLGGTCETDHTNTVTSDAGGDGYTRGHDSVLGGTTVTTPVTGPVDACGNVAGGGGMADAVCNNTSTSEAGGNTGTTGDDSVGGGNNGSVPVAIPVEGLGNAGGAIGDAETEVIENKVSSAGGGNNSNDDAAVAGANLVTVPVAGPVQVFGNGAGAVANTETEMDGVSSVTAGGPSQSKGTLGTLSGNIGQAPVAVPTQVFGVGAHGVGNGVQTATNTTDSTAGGDAVTDGTDGNLAGNLVTAPVASTAQVFGSAVAAGGDSLSVADNATQTTAGGSGTTSGEFGNISGNIVGAQALPVAQGFGDAVSGVAGDATGVATSTTVGQSGGDLTTNGDHGSLSGNLVDVPAAALVQPHGDAVSAIGAQALGVSDNVTTGSVGGTSQTSGEDGQLNGIDLTAPVGVDAPIYDVPVEVLAEAVAQGTHFSDVAVGEQDPMALALPKAGVLEATQVPALPSLGSMSKLPVGSTARTDVPNPFAELFTSTLSGHNVTDTLPMNTVKPRSADPVTDVLGNLFAEAPLGVTPGQTPLDGVSGMVPAQGAHGLANGAAGLVTLSPALPRTAAPVMPGLDAVPGLDNVEGAFAGNLVQTPSVDRLPVQTPALSGLDTASALPTAAAPSLADTQSRLTNLVG
ncbi:beta strand repeat-containing protein [Actinokineospora guangxiensis]|uniref:Beta strand repeat-containing protein n=1 Tax=Actinokineospora guangxiensis TaxID=1490288 RepID=A0ABW0EE04_9PSEU